MIPVWPLLLLLTSIPLIADATASSLDPNAAVCFGHRASIPFSGHAWLPLNHRHGPCSPFPSSEKIHSSTADMLRRRRRDRLRTTAGMRRGALNGTSTARRGDATLPTRLGTSLDTAEYVVTVGLGTPAITQTLIIDSGSDLSWLQCRPCPMPPCHAQDNAVFDPAMSATYSAFSCASAGCRELGSTALFNGCSAGSLCQYGEAYADGSSTTGTYSSDKLTLTSTCAVDGFRFGCSHAAPLYTDRTAGLLGLGRGALSLVRQTAVKAFSYCLPPTVSHSGFLTLGVPPRVSAASRFVVTPMYNIQNSTTVYGVLLQGITVAGRRLRRIPPSVFAGGSVVDSGTDYTQLPRTAHRALTAAFRKEMRMYTRVAPTNGFHTCFNFSGRDVKLPSVALVFHGGATVELDQSGIISDEGCLAFDSNGDDTSYGFIGHWQQRTLEVLYDIGGQAVGFRRGAC